MNFISILIEIGRFKYVKSISILVEIGKDKMTNREQKGIWKYAWLIYLIVILGLIYIAYAATLENPTDTTAITGMVTLEEEIPPMADNVCVNCHSTVGSDTAAYRMPVQEWYTSIHYGEGIECVDCHGGDATNRSSAMSNLFFDTTNHANVSEMLCGRVDCHGEIYEEFKDSTHNELILNLRTGEMDRASACTDCHGIHQTKNHTNPESPLYVSNMPDTCGKCHSSEQYSFQDTYHGKYLELGSDNVAVCSDCHGAHDIRATDDPDSMAHPDKVAETCADCHQNELDLDISEGYVHNEGNLEDEREEAYSILGFDLRSVIPFVYLLALGVLVSMFIIFMFMENIGRPAFTKTGKQRSDNGQNKKKEEIIDEEEISNTEALNTGSTEGSDGPEIVGGDQP